MFQFPGFAPIARYYAFSIVGCPIRTSADQFVLANPRSFSQLITSFFASESLGIPHTPLFTSLFNIDYDIAIIAPITYVLAYHLQCVVANSSSMTCL